MLRSLVHLMAALCASALVGGRATAQVGAAYCAANVNSTGSTSLISGSGSADVAANNLVVACAGLPLSSFGFFIVSRDQAFVANPGGSAGNLCLGGSIGRYSLSILNSGATGAVSLPIDLSNVPHPTAPFAALPGDTLNFQYWHRDSTPGGGATSNFSQGLEVQLASVVVTPSFSSAVYPLFTTLNNFNLSCTSCHGGTCGLDLSSPAAAYSAIVGVAANCCSGATYVIPGDAPGSLLYQKLTNPSCGALMPFVGDFPGDVNVIRDWIAGGAPNN
ncbi:MAG: hypothetical protein R3F49_12445 [Planctomycetota bacterium]